MPLQLGLRSMHRHFQQSRLNVCDFFMKIFPVQVLILRRGSNRTRDCDDHSVHGKEIRSPGAGGSLCGVPEEEPAGRQCVHAPHTGTTAQTFTAISVYAQVEFESCMFEFL